MNSIHDLTPNDLRTLANAIRMGRLTVPFTMVGVKRYCPDGDSASIAGTLQRLNGEGAPPAAIASMLELLADGRDSARKADAVDLVWTGPESAEVPSRDTSVVVRDLFINARQHVLVAGYAVYQGKEVFRALAERMSACPDLKVEMFLDIQRGQNDTTIPEDIIRRFTNRFSTKEWPGQRLPDIYYDPRSLSMDKGKRSSLHAKCVVVDGRSAFVSSANFTEAAQARNIEVGVLIQSSNFAERLVRHFQTLAKAGALKCVLAATPSTRGEHRTDRS